VCVEGAFHGRTLATLAAGWSAAKREPFEPVPSGFSHVPRNDLAALAAAVGPGTCAVLVEPIQGEGGVWPLDTAWLELARELCDRHGALLLYDEVQTGIGRCGTWFCAELAGVRPDATAVAKGLAGGFPIGALLASDITDGGFERGDHATTFGGSPPIAAAALAVLEAIEREGLVENARNVGQRISERAARLRGVDHVRGAGLLLAIELVDAPAAEIAGALLRRGMLVNAITPTALRLVPPLCLSQGEADRFCATFEDVLTARLDQRATTMA
jgi:acetylornithine/succinyldiaminopimelate/putrescine aminotransferase